MEGTAHGDTVPWPETGPGEPPVRVKLPWEMAGMEKDEGYCTAGDSMQLTWEHKVHFETFILQ